MFNIVARDTPFKVMVGVVKFPDNVKLTALAVPVKFGLANGAFVPINVAMVVEKLGSLPNASANSFSVSNVAGADATKLAIVVLTYAACAVDIGLLTSDVLSTCLLYTSPSPRD